MRHRITIIIFTIGTIGHCIYGMIKRIPNGFEFLLRSFRFPLNRSKHISKIDKDEQIR